MSFGRRRIQNQFRYCSEVLWSSVLTSFMYPLDANFFCFFFIFKKYGKSIIQLRLVIVLFFFFLSSDRSRNKLIILWGTLSILSLFPFSFTRENVWRRKTCIHTLRTLAVPFSRHFAYRSLRPRHFWTYYLHFLKVHKNLNIPTSDPPLKNESKPCGLTLGPKPKIEGFLVWLYGQDM